MAAKFSLDQASVGAAQLNAATDAVPFAAVLGVIIRL